MRYSYVEDIPFDLYRITDTQMNQYWCKLFVSFPQIAFGVIILFVLPTTLDFPTMSNVANSPNNALIRVLSIKPQHLSAPFRSSWNVDITVDCFGAVIDDAFDVKVTYLGCAADSSKDEMLDWATLSPLQLGRSTIHLELPPPQTDQLNNEDLLDVSAIVFEFLYADQVFQRGSFFIRLQYPDECTDLVTVRAQHLETIERLQTSESIDVTHDWPAAPPVNLDVLLREFADTPVWTPQLPIRWSLDDHELE